MSNPINETPNSRSMTEKSTKHGKSRDSAAIEPIVGPKAFPCDDTRTRKRPKNEVSDCLQADEQLKCKAEKGKRKPLIGGDESQDDIRWVQCFSCQKWRVVPGHIDPLTFPEVWDCSMITWWAQNLRNCKSPEQTCDSEVTITPQLEGRLGSLESAIKPYQLQNDIQSTSKIMQNVRPISIRPFKISLSNTEPLQARGVPIDVPVYGSISKRARSTETNVSRAAICMVQNNEQESLGQNRDRTSIANSAEGESSLQDIWVQCCTCQKWRIVPEHIDALTFPELWDCSMITWWAENLRNCKSPEQTCDSEVTITPKLEGRLGSLESAMTPSTTVQYGRSTLELTDPVLADKILFDAQNTTKISFDASTHQDKRKKSNTKPCGASVTQSPMDFFNSCPDDVFMSIVIPGENIAYTAQPAEIEITDDDLFGIPIDYTYPQTLPNIKLEEGIIREFSDMNDFYENCPDEVWMSIGIPDEYRSV